MTPDVRAILTNLDNGKPVVTGQMELVHCNIYDKPVTFCVDFERDPIQRHHRRGKFYEAPELDHLRTVLKPGAVVFDIGANTGNHSLFFAMELAASRVLPIEPNPRVYRLLISNVVVNGLRGVIDLSFLGVGLSDRNEGGFAMEDRAANLGAARMRPGAGDIETCAGDDLFRDIAPDLIKIDIEGMEMRALAGLSRTIRSHHPLLFIEVDVSNDDAFREWVSTEGYDILKTWQRYESNRNYLLAHAG